MSTTVPEKVDLLDHGYLECVERWGSDEDIVRAARMSTGKGFLGWGQPTEWNICSKCGVQRQHAFDPDGSPYLTGNEQLAACAGSHDFVEKPGDERLLRYLYKNRHDTPFEMAGMIVEVRAPIVVFREWHRHRIPWSYNEASARYAPLPALDFLPTVERCMRDGGHLTKQAATAANAKMLTETEAERWLGRLDAWQKLGEDIYQDGLQIGIPKELARGSMSVFRYSTMRASANLRGWLHFLGLRSAPNAQEEIRVYANAAATMLRNLFPRVMALYDANKSHASG